MPRIELGISLGESSSLEVFPGVPAGNFQQLAAIVEIVEVGGETRISIVENTASAKQLWGPGRRTAPLGARARSFIRVRKTKHMHSNSG